MVENADDDPGETKPNFVKNSGDIKPPKVEAKPNIDGASVHVEASLYVDSGVVPLDSNKVNTTHFSSSEEVKWKDKDDLLNWVRRQTNRAGFNIVIHRSNLINHMLQLVYERSGDNKVFGKKSKHETTSSRKCRVYVHGSWF